LVPIAAAAAPSPAPSDARARDGGILDGRVTAVDYQKSTLGVDAAGRGRLTVTVMPTTSVQSKDNGYHTLLDVKPGSHVQIFTSVSGATIIAQIIRLLP
jgi:hypothetical protein